MIFDRIRSELPPNEKATYSVGDIIKDVDYDDEFAIITRIGLDSASRITYEYRDLADMSCIMFSTETELNKWYEVIS